MNQMYGIFNAHRSASKYASGARSHLFRYLTFTESLDNSLMADRGREGEKETDGESEGEREHGDPRLN